MVLDFAWTAVLPAVMDILKKGAERIITGRRMTVDDEIRLMQAETEKLKALAELDRPETNISPVIASFRASFRYVFCLLIFLGTLLCIFGGRKAGIYGGNAGPFIWGGFLFDWA
jgi:hypothetical protein